MKGPDSAAVSAIAAKLLVKRAATSAAPKSARANEQAGSPREHGLPLCFVALDRRVLAEPDPPAVSDFDEPVDVVNTLANVLAVVLTHRRELDACRSQQLRNLQRPQASINEDVREHAVRI